MARAGSGPRRDEPIGRGNEFLLRVNLADYTGAGSPHGPVRCRFWQPRAAGAPRGLHWSFGGILSFVHGSDAMMIRIAHDDRKTPDDPARGAAGCSGRV